MINFDTYIDREVYIIAEPLNNFYKENWMNLIYESIERKDYAFILER